MSDEKFAPRGTVIGFRDTSYSRSCRYFTSSINPYVDLCSIVYKDMRQAFVHDRQTGEVYCGDPEPLTKDGILWEFRDIVAYEEGVKKKLFAIRELMEALYEALIHRHGKEKADAPIQALKDALSTCSRSISSFTPEAEARVLFDKFIVSADEALRDDLLYVEPPKAELSQHSAPPSPDPILPKEPDPIPLREPDPKPLLPLHKPTFKSKLMNVSFSSLRYSVVMTVIPKIVPKTYQRPAALAAAFSLSYYESQSLYLSILTLMAQCLPLNARSKIMLASMFIALSSVLSNDCVYTIDDQCVPLTLAQNFLLMASGLLVGMATGVATEKLLEHAIAYSKSFSPEKSDVESKRSQQSYIVAGHSAAMLTHRKHRSEDDRNQQRDDLQPPVCREELDADSMDSSMSPV